MALNVSQASQYPVTEQYLDQFSTKIGLIGNVQIARPNEIMLSKSYGVSDFKAQTPLLSESQFRFGSVTK
jgi:hypothetical protein